MVLADLKRDVMERSQNNHAGKPNVMQCSSFKTKAHILKTQMQMLPFYFCQVQVFISEYRKLKKNTEGSGASEILDFLLTIFVLWLTFT